MSAESAPQASRQAASIKTIESWLKQYPDLEFSDEQVKSRLRCKVCNEIISINLTRKSVVTKHCNSDKHKLLNRASKFDRGEFETEDEEFPPPPPLSDGTDKQKQFNLDLLQLFIGCHIPQSHMNNPVFRKFIEKCVKGEYGVVKIPSESTLRKKYLPQMTTEEAQARRIKDKKFFGKKKRQKLETELLLNDKREENLFQTEPVKVEICYP